MSRLSALHYRGACRDAPEVALVLRFAASQSAAEPDGATDDVPTAASEADVSTAASTALASDEASVEAVPESAAATSEAVSASEEAAQASRPSGGARQGRAARRAAHLWHLGESQP